MKKALGTVVKKAIDAGLKYYERQTDMDTVYKKLTTAFSNYNKTECMNPPSNAIVQVNSSAMSTGETFTEPTRHNACGSLQELHHGAYLQLCS